MFDRGGQHVPFARLRNQRAVDRGIVALRAATGEDHLARVGVDQRGDLFARGLDVPRHRLAEMIRAGRIAIMLAQKRQHRLHHFRRDPRRGVVVEIINLPLIHTGISIHWIFCRPDSTHNVSAPASQHCAGSIRLNPAFPENFFMRL